MCDASGIFMVRLKDDNLNFMEGADSLDNDFLWIDGRSMEWSFLDGEHS